jgi:L-ascorbate metabolism protein UlaG (beta-lactamase superfamily)
VDIAFLPLSGTYVMTADGAVQASKAINAKIPIPDALGRDSRLGVQCQEIQKGPGWEC